LTHSTISFEQGHCISWTLKRPQHDARRHQADFTLRIGADQLSQEPSKGQKQENPPASISVGEVTNSDCREWKEEKEQTADQAALLRAQAEFFLDLRDAYAKDRTIR